MSPSSERMKDRGIIGTLMLALVISPCLVIPYAVICSSLEQGTPINLRRYDDFLTSGGLVTRTGTISNPRWLHDSYYCFTFPYDRTTRWLSRRRAARVLPGKWSDGRTAIGLDEDLTLTLKMNAGVSTDITFKSSSKDFGTYTSPEGAAWVSIYPTDTDDAIRCRVADASVKSAWFTLKRLK